MLPPKNGCHTLVSLFKNIKQIDRVAFDTLEHHYTLESFAKNYPEYDLSGFTFYGFYRNPIDRFLSSYEFSKRYYELEYVQRVLYKNTNPAPRSLIDKLRLKAGTIPSLKTLTVQQYFDSLDEIENVKSKSHQPKLDTFSLQKNYLDIPNLTLLNFANFNQEVLNLLSLFDHDLTIDIDDVPKKNASVDMAITRDTITSHELELIKSFCREDYEFFASKGITFTD